MEKLPRTLGVVGFTRTVRDGPSGLSPFTVMPIGIGISSVQATIGTDRPFGEPL